MFGKKKEKSALIIAGGVISDSFAAELISKYTFQLVICADKGLEAARRIGLKVDYAVGDFDSVSASVLEQYMDKTSNTIVRKFQPEKDYTDSQIALEIALKEDIDKIIILGATGSRFDHCLANVHLLKMALEAGKEAYILDENNCILLINKDIVLEKASAFGDYISLIPLTEQVSNITLKGFRYGLKDYTMSIGNSIGISNEIKEDKAYISFETGILVVVQSRD